MSKSIDKLLDKYSFSFFAVIIIALFISISLNENIFFEMRALFSILAIISGIFIVVSGELKLKRLLLIIFIILLSFVFLDLNLKTWQYVVIFIIILELLFFLYSSKPKGKQKKNIILYTIEMKFEAALKALPVFAIILIISNVFANGGKYFAEIWPYIESITPVIAWGAVMVIIIAGYLYVNSLKFRDGKNVKRKRKK